MYRYRNGTVENNSLSWTTLSTHVVFVLADTEPICLKPLLPAQHLVHDNDYAASLLVQLSRPCLELFLARRLAEVLSNHRSLYNSHQYRIRRQDNLQATGMRDE